MFTVSAIIKIKLGATNFRKIALFPDSTFRRNAKSNVEAINYPPAWKFPPALEKYTKFSKFFLTRKNTSMKK
jgi:hypothetical protein